MSRFWNSALSITTGPRPYAQNPQPLCEEMHLLLASPSCFLSFFFLFGGRKGVGSPTQPSARLRTDADVGGNDLWVNLPCFTATVSAVASRSGPYKGAAASNYIRPLILIQVSAIQDYNRRGHPNKKQRAWIIYKLRPQSPRRRAFADDLYLNIPQR